MNNTYGPGNGYFFYPILNGTIVSIPNVPAPERLLGERSGDPYLGGSPPSEPRAKGLQPGFDYAGIPLSSLGK